jgi:uncharacterized membrane protein YjjP (DUF1212 family)
VTSIQVDAPSPSPADSITPGPDQAPTPSQSANPTASPTDTAGPTESPTASPSGSASSSAGSSPSAAPSHSVTATPAASPRATTAAPASKPAVVTSTVPTLSVVLAVVVLGAAVVILVQAVRRRRLLPPPPPPPERDREAEATRVVPFLVALGEAMIDSGDPVTHVQDTLRRVAGTNQVSAAGIVVLPTALIVSVPGEHDTQTSVSIAGTSNLRLEQVDEVFLVAADAVDGRTGAVDGLARLLAARSLPPSFGIPARVAGHVVLTVGLAMILGGSALDLLVSAVLGAAVGMARVSTHALTFAYQVFVPVLSAFGVAVIVLLLPRTGLPVGILAPLIAPLVMFLPGALLTTSVIELATGQMVSGASRLAAGAMQLTLLALGIIAGMQLVGVPASGLRESSQPLGPVAPWIGVALFGAGVVVHRCARRQTAGWILLVLYVAYAGQVIGGLFLGGVLSALVGALCMTPVAVMVASFKSGPATLVSFLPAFWLLVPGALGLVGLTQLLGPDRASGLQSLLTTAATMIAIAFGVLLGLAAASGITALSSGRLRVWPARQPGRTG